MAIDYEKKAKTLRDSADVIEITGDGKVHDPYVKFLRQFAAEVIRDIASDAVYVTAVLNGKCCTELERRAAEIEAGR